MQYAKNNRMYVYISHYAIQHGFGYPASQPQKIRQSTRGIDGSHHRCADQ